MKANRSVRAQERRANVGIVLASGSKKKSVRECEAVFQPQAVLLLPPQAPKLLVPGSARPDHWH